MEQAAPFWEETYRSDDVMTFSPAPNKAVTEYEHLFDKDAAVLEAGCGEGQNVLYLAKRGFRDIDAFDISQAGIAKLKRRCEASGVCIHAFVKDLARYTFDRGYGLVMSFATLCFLERSVWRQFIADAKAGTRMGGIHIMHTYTDKVAASPDIAPFAVGLAHEGELRELYGDWEILDFRSYTFEDEHPGVPKHLHAVNKIVARKTGPFT